MCVFPCVQTARFKSLSEMSSFKLLRTYPTNKGGLQNRSSVGIETLHTSLSVLGKESYAQSALVDNIWPKILFQKAGERGQTFRSLVEIY